MPCIQALTVSWIALLVALIVGDRAQTQRKFAILRRLAVLCLFSLVLLVLVPLLVFKLVEILVSRRIRLLPSSKMCLAGT